MITHLKFVIWSYLVINLCDFLADVNEELRAKVLKALSTKNLPEVDEAVKEFESKADPSTISQQDKELMEKIKNMLNQCKIYNVIWKFLN